MQEWINNVLTLPGLSLIMLPAMLLLGVLNALVSTCNIPVIGALTGYAGTRESDDRRDIIVIAMSFMLGTILALAVAGAIIGYAGQIVGDSFGHYSKVLAGLMLVFFGLLALGFVPVNKLKFPTFKQREKKQPGGILGTVVFAFTLGGASMLCNLSCCNPILPVVLGTAGIQGQWVKSATLVGVYAIGYSLPLGAIILGVGFGKWTFRASRAMPVIKIIAGILLLVVGFYFLATI